MGVSDRVEASSLFSVSQLGEALNSISRLGEIILLLELRDLIDAKCDFF